MKKNILIITLTILLFNGGCKKSEDNTDSAFVYPNSFAPYSVTHYGPQLSIWMPLGPIQGSDVIYDSYSMKIYTRNDKLVFKNDTIFRGWDGKVNDIICPLDYYYFVVKYETTDGVKHKDNGMFQLIK